MLIILEGNDATGKTQLAQHLEADYGFIYYHFGPPDKHPIDEWGSLIEAYTPGAGVNVVMDRLHWGELVYAPHYRGKSQLGYPGFEWMERAIQARGGVTVLCEGDTEKILERVIALEDDYVEKNLEHLQMLSDLYTDTWKRARTPVYRHNFDAGWEVNLNVVFAMARNLERAAAPMDREYLGSLGASVLFVGDINGGVDSDINMFPFPAYDSRGCGYYLMETLLLIPALDEYGIINAYTAYDGTPREDLIETWERLDEPRAVALGTNASDVLTELGIAHGVTYHPAYVKRFKFGEQKLYGNSIWNAVLSLNDTTAMFT